jgi:hypothetical protein
MRDSAAWLLIRLWIFQTNTAQPFFSMAKQSGSHIAISEEDWIFSGCKEGLPLAFGPVYEHMITKLGRTGILHLLHLVESDCFHY